MFFVTESLKAICEAFIVAIEIACLPAVPFRQNKLDKRKSKVLSSDSSSLLGPGSYLDVTSLPHMTRNVSETQLLALKNVGTKALNNVTQQFNKLNKLGHSFNTRKPKLAADNSEKEKVNTQLFRRLPSDMESKCSSLSPQKLSIEPCSEPVQPTFL
jgi:hypothetical protein